MQSALRSQYRSETLRCVALPGLTVDVCRLEFDALDDVPLPIFEDEHVLALSLSPQPRNSSGRYPAAAMDFVPSGEITFKPAGFSVRARNDGGTQTMLRCRFADERVRAVAERPPAWGPQSLAACLDVTAADVAAGLCRIARELERQGSPDRVAIESAATLLLVDVVRSLAPTATAGYARGGLTPSQLSRLRARVANEARPIATVAELAVLLGMSERHLLRGFRAAAGTSLREGLQEIAAARACDWLAAGDLPVKAIAWRLGYGSPASFSTAFLRRTGETPSAYRRRRLAAAEAFVSETPKRRTSGD